jgi:hypothetical protein
MWDPFFGLALEQSVAGLGLETVYSQAYLFLREAIWWWVVSILLALLFDVFLATTVGASTCRKSPEGIEGEAASIPHLAGE